MNDDLTDARACIEWTIAQLPAFEQRLLFWLDDNIEVVVIETPADAPKDLLVARENEAVPLHFNVEAGAYINTIRSSLDILASTIARREMVLFPDEFYFPVANSAADFAAGNYRGSKFVRQLSGTARKLIESLHPYSGGNKALWALHQFDILRKHRRLLAAGVSPQRAEISWSGENDTFKPALYYPVTITPVVGHHETVLGALAKGAKKPEVQYAAAVILNEPSIMQPCAISTALNYFASTANEIVDLFDY